MRISELDPGLKGLLNTVDYDATVFLRVSAIESERVRDQRAVIQIIQGLIAGNPEWAKKYADVSAHIQDQQFNARWDDKRRLGHIQRCVSSGDRVIERFGIEMIRQVGLREKLNKADQVLYSESHDARMAWTLSPFLLEGGKSMRQIMNWVGTGDHNPTHPGIYLRGVRELFLRGPFVLPDRFDTILRGINPRIPPLSLHQNYPVAQAIAQHLITSRAV